MAEFPLPSTQSKIDSKCSGCGDDIHVGDVIVKKNEEDGGEWVCVACSQDYDDEVIE